MRNRLVLVLPAVLCTCRSPSSTSSVASTTNAAPVPSATASASAPASASASVEDTTYAKHQPATLIAECIARSFFGYTCNNAYPAAKERFPADAEAIHTLMKLAVRVGAGDPLGGEGEVTSGCDVKAGDGSAYPCLYLAEVEGKTAAGKAAHALACKGAPPEGQLPVAGGTAACDGDRPVHVAPLPKAEAEEVKRCFACGFDPSIMQSQQAPAAPSAKACAALRKRSSAREAALIERAIEPLCPKGS